MNRAAVAWAIGFIAFALTAVGMTLLALVPAERAPGGERLIDVVRYFPMTLSFATVGALVASRRPGNPIGWLLLCAGAWNGLQYFASEYAVFGLFGGSDLPGAQLSAWLFSWAGALGMLLVVAVIYLFPDARFALNVPGSVSPSGHSVAWPWGARSRSPRGRSSIWLREAGR